MSTQIISFDITPILIQAGYGAPDHVSSLGTEYTDLYTALKYVNKDGILDWVQMLDITYPFSGGSGTIFTGGTVTGPTYFLNGVTANTMSATTYYGDGSHLTGIGSSTFTGGTVTGPTRFTAGLSTNTISATTYYNLPTDIRVTGGTYNGGNLIFINNTGGTFNVTGITTTSGYSANYYGSFSNTGNLPVSGANIATVWTYNTTEISNGIVIENSSKIKVYNTGVYEFGYSPQIEKTQGTDANVTIWAAINGVPVTRSSSTIRLVANSTLSLPYVAFIFSMNANDYLEFYFSSDSQYVQLTSLSGLTGPTRPNSPSLIVDVKQVGNAVTNTLVGAYLPLSGGTVTGATNFINGLSANTISATTYYNLPLDIRVTGSSLNASTYDFTLTRNDGVTITSNLGLLASDMTITGGTYNINTGVVTFTNNTGGTFNVTGFTSGMTDTYTTGGTVSSGTATFTKSNGGTYSVSGFATQFTGGTVTGDTLFTNGITANTISATTYNGYIPANNSGVVHILSAETITGVKTFSPSVTAATAIARGTYLTPTLVAAANNDVLIGLDIKPTISGGTFTGITNFSIRVSSGIIPASAGGTAIGTGSLPFSNGVFNGIVYSNNFNGYAGGFYFGVSGINMGRFHSTTGNFTFQSGGTFTDAGYRLDVSGTTRLNGNTLINGNFTGSSIISTGGIYAVSAYTGSYVDGIVTDYVIGNGRISVGTADGLSFYNGGVGSNLLLNLSSGGTLSGTSNINSGSFTTTTINGSNTSAAIVVSGSNTIGGTGYTDFIKVINTAVGATNINKTFRVTNVGNIEIVNSAYNGVALTLSDNGNLSVGGYLNPTTWTAGQVIKDTMLSNTDVTVSTTTIATSNSDTDFVTYSYTPASSTSYLIIHYHLANYDASSGTGNDSWFSRIKVDGTEITYSHQSTVNGNRSGVLFPLTGRYTNSNTTAKSIVVACRRDSADDSITITNTATSMWLRITEIAR